MKKPKKDIFSQVETVARDVIKNLKNSGYIVPSRLSDGSIRFDNYIVKKENTGFYSVKDINDRIYVENLNLPQTAAVIANNLALGKILDNKLIALDNAYGYKIFDRELFKKNSLKKNNIDQFIYYKTQMDTAIIKAKYIKDDINRSFLKLYWIA